MIRAAQATQFAEDQSMNIDDPIQIDCDKCGREVRQSELVITDSPVENWDNWLCPECAALGLTYDGEKWI
jgi:Zn finger protein HypA/HybF involved in hydrogenase expression